MKSEQEPIDPGPSASAEVKAEYLQKFRAWRAKYVPNPDMDHFNPIADDFGGRSTVRGKAHSANT